MFHTSLVSTELPTGITWKFSQFKIFVQFSRNERSFLQYPACNFFLLFILLVIKYKYWPPKPVRSPSVSSFFFLRYINLSLSCRTFPDIKDLKLRRGSVVARLLRLRVRVPPIAWISVAKECCVLSGRGLGDGLITRPEESYRL